MMQSHSHESAYLGK